MQGYSGMKKANKAPTIEQDLCVGVITSVNGVKGYVKIRSFTEDSRDICSFKNIFDKDTNTQFKIKLVSAKKDYIIAGIEGVENRNEAEKLRNTKLYITRDELPSLKKEEFYHADLIGMEVRTEDSISLGLVRNLMNFGAGDILEVQDLITEKVSYYPFNKQFIVKVDASERIITVTVLEEVLAADD